MNTLCEIALSEISRVGGRCEKSLQGGDRNTPDELGENGLKDFEAFCLKIAQVKARIWP